MPTSTMQQSVILTVPISIIRGFGKICWYADINNIGPNIYCQFADIQISGMRQSVIFAALIYRYRQCGYSYNMPCRYANRQLAIFALSMCRYLQCGNRYNILCRCGDIRNIGQIYLPTYQYTAMDKRTIYNICRADVLILEILAKYFCRCADMQMLAMRCWLLTKVADFLQKKMVGAASGLFFWCPQL